MRRIFVSYRRDDSSFETTAIYKELASVFGDSNVFIDVDDIRLGEDFKRRLHATLQQINAAIVVIGLDWLESRDDQDNRRLDSEDDYVRQEIESALAIPDCLVIPVLVGGAKLPKAEELPDSLKPLVDRQAVPIRTGRDYDHDLGYLIRELGGKVSSNVNKSALWVGLAVVAIAVGACFVPSKSFYDHKIEDEATAQLWKGIGIGIATLVLLAMGPTGLIEKGGFVHRTLGLRPKKIQLVFIGLAWLALAIGCAVFVNQSENLTDLWRLFVMALGWATLMGAVGVFLFVAFYQGDKDD